MKKLFIIISIFLLSFFIGCNDNKDKENENKEDTINENNEDKNNDASKPSSLDLSEYLIKIDYMVGYYGPISSFIFISDNEYLLKYLARELYKVKFTEELTDDNMDPTSKFGSNKQISFTLGDGKKLTLTLTDLGNMYITLYEKSNLKDDNRFIKKWAYKSISPSEYALFSRFTLMGAPSNHFWRKTPVCYRYLDDIDVSENNQDFIVGMFIDHFAPVNEYYESGALFGGNIRKYFGKFNDYYVAIIDCDGLGYDEALWVDTIDGVRINYNDGNQIYLISGSGIYTLKEGFENGFISHDDLVVIANQTY